MRRLSPLAALFLAACATRPASTPTPAPIAPAAVSVEQPPLRGDLIGLSANELVARFGTPRLQVGEGSGTKFQFANSSCVLDAYLYAATGGGVLRVAHVDTRDRQGRSIAQDSCIAALGRR
jgi:hypothetical protein